MELIKNLKKVPVGWVRLPVSCFIKAVWNYKIDDEDKAEKLTANIKRNGQVQNIIVRNMGNGKFEIANGNHRLDSFLKLKYKDAVCYNLGKVTQAAAERVAIETNEQSFDPDPVKLGQVIEHIMEEFDKDDLLATMPYSDVDFDALIAAGGFNPEEDLPPSEFDPESEETTSKIPVSKVLTAVGIMVMPKSEVEALSRKLVNAIAAWGLNKSDRWQILDKVGNPPKIEKMMKKKKPLTKKG